MTVLTPQAGVTRLRAFQLGLESSFKTQVPATRRMPWSFAPDVNPNWTKPTADTGTLDLALAPYRTALDVTGAATGQLFSNDVPTVLSAGIMGGLSFTGASTAKTMTAAPSATSQDVFDTYTGEWFDDATGDAWAGTGGIITDFELEYPQDQGPINLTANMRFAKVVYPATPTAGLSVDSSPVPLYCADTWFFVNDTAGAIGTTQLVDQVYGATLSVQNNIDVKRWANGNSTAAASEFSSTPGRSPRPPRRSQSRSSGSPPTRLSGSRRSEPSRSSRRSPASITSSAGGSPATGSPAPNRRSRRIPGSLSPASRSTTAR